ncbi:hypothetical protein ACHAXM_009456 [Skeletonema potamos]
MMASLFMLFILLLLPLEARSHFLHNQVKRRTNNDNNINSHLLSSPHTITYNPRRRHLSIPVAFLSIRGGSEGEEEEDNFSDFVSSFESELMEIRQQAEIEAEAELQKLRSLLGEQQGIDDYEEGDEDSDGEDAFINKDDDDASSTVEPKEEDDNSADEKNDIDEESSVEEETKDVSDVEDDEESSVQVEETKDHTDDETSISPTADQSDQLEGDEGISESEKTTDIIGSGEENDEVHSEDKPVDNEFVDSFVKEDSITTIDDTDAKKTGKPKRSKAKKSKSNKPTSKSNKSSSSMLDYFESMSDGKVGTVESKVLTRTVEAEVETRPRGINSFLKSDLVRALSLFIATIVVSVLMQRLQRQMEAQGL